IKIDDSIPELYDDAIIYDHHDGRMSLTGSQTFSLQLIKLADEFKTSREFQRELCKLINNNLIDKYMDETTKQIKTATNYNLLIFLTIGLGGHIPSPDTIHRILRRVNNFGSELVKNYPVCPKGCALFVPPSDNHDISSIPSCRHCQSAIYHDNHLERPRQMLSYVSVGAALAEMLLDDTKRELFSYRHDFDQTRTGNSYCDIFDGAAYRQDLQQGLYSSPSDIGVILYVDGFQAKHKRTTSLTLVHCVVANIDPSSRYIHSYL
ncbi:MAG: hypothetical protein EXX96DRAFT_490275, partial [Benjaminiella poitrasii]